MKILTGKDKLMYERLHSVVTDYYGFLKYLQSFPDDLERDCKTIKITRRNLQHQLSQITSTLDGYNDYLLKSN